MRHAPRRTAAFLFAIAFEACRARRAPPARVSRGTTAAPRHDRPDAATPRQGCRIEVAGGWRLGEGGVPTIAARGDDALVTATRTVVSPMLDEPGRRGSVRAFRSVIATGDASGALEELPAPTRAGGADVWAAAVARGDALATLTFSVAPRSGGVYSLVTAGRRDGPARHVAGDAALLLAAARDDRVIGVSVVGPSRALQLRAVAWTGRAAEVHVVAPVALQPEDFFLPGWGAVAIGVDGAAVAFRSGDALRVATLDRAGRPTGALQTVATGAIGAATAAYRDATLVVVWAQRDADAAAGSSSLRWAAWDPTREQPAAPRRLDTGASSVAMPALAIEGRRAVLAWTEGDPGARRVRLGASEDFARLADAPITVSDADADAVVPAVALTSTRGWVAWAQDGARGSELRASPVRCW